jgi:hypothetical protein
MGITWAWASGETRAMSSIGTGFPEQAPPMNDRDALHVRQVSPETNEQVGGYLKILIEKYRLIEKRLPIFAKKKEKKGRY